ncbi:MAG: hypothetical protein ACI9FG_001053 [Crocinitomicaceae bacterium]|jgi:hypothetical protein
MSSPNSLHTSSADNVSALTKSIWWDFATLPVFLWLAVSAFLTIPQLGVSWDEHFHLAWGAEKWENYQALFSGKIEFEQFLQLSHSSVHPGFFDLMVQGVIRITFLSPNDSSHLLSFVFGFLGLIGTWLTGRKLLGPIGGFFALLLLLTAPRYFGHMWFNPKDIPFAACYIWCLYFLLVVISEFPRPRWTQVLLLGVVTGLALGVRLAGLLIPLYFGAACLLFLIFQSRRVCQFKSDLLSLFMRGVCSAGVAYLCVLPFWPALWKSPAGGVSESVGEAQSFGWDGPVLFSGAFERSTELPWHYLPHWILVTLPEWTLILLVLALVLLLWKLSKHREQFKLTVVFGGVVVCLSALFPILYVIATGPTLYDGMRHFIFLLPPLMIIAAAGIVFSIQFLIQALPTRPWAIWLPPAFSLLLCLKILLVDYRSLEPYYYIYFNGWVGGLGGAYNNYETDYWGLSYREAFDSLEEYVSTLEEKKRSEPWTVSISGVGFLVAPFLTDSFELSRDRDAADFYIAYTRLDQHMKGRGEIVRVVRRAGVPLNVIWDQRGED